MARDLTLEEIDGRRRTGGAAAHLVMDRRLEQEQARAAERAKRNVELAISRFQTSLGRAAPLSDPHKVVHRLLRSAFPTAGLASQRRVMPGGGTSFHFEYKSVQPCTIALRPGHKTPPRNKPGRWEFAKDRSSTSRPVAHQIYIADEKKVDPVLHGAPGLCFSFGADGLSFADMCRMWELAEQYPERTQNAVIQHRLILELPHSALPRDRIAIMKEFAAPLEKEGIPFWVAIHAPTADNDERNVHAHLIFLNRPARQIPWPDGGDVGAPAPTMVPTWDFAAVEKKKDRHRKTRTRFPERQNVPELLRGGFIKDWRARYAEVVNRHMIAAGSRVRFDPRSYADAGITGVVPERKAGYARKLNERPEPSLDAVLTGLAVKALSETEGNDGGDVRRLNQAKKLAEVGGEPWLSFLARANLLGADREPSARLKADRLAARASASKYFNAEQELVTLKRLHASEHRVQRAVVEASFSDGICRARSQLQAASVSRPFATRHRSVEQLALLNDDTANRGIHDAAREVLSELQAKHSQELRAAQQAALVAKVAWLATFQDEEITMSDRNSPQADGSAQVSATTGQPSRTAPTAVSLPLDAASPDTPQVATAPRRPGPLVRSPEYIAKLKEDIEQGRFRRVNPHEITSSSQRKWLPKDDVGAQEDARNAALYGEMSESDRRKANARRSALLAAKQANSRKGKGF